MRLQPLLQIGRIIVQPRILALQALKILAMAGGAIVEVGLLAPSCRTRVHNDGILYLGCILRCHPAVSHNLHCHHAGNKNGRYPQQPMPLPAHGHTLQFICYLCSRLNKTNSKAGAKDMLLGSASRKSKDCSLRLLSELWVCRSRSPIYSFEGLTGEAYRWRIGFSIDFPSSHHHSVVQVVNKGDVR